MPRCGQRRTASPSARVSVGTGSASLCIGKPYYRASLKTSFPTPARSLFSAGCIGMRLHPISRGAGMKVVLANPRGFCAGVVRAIDIVELALQRFGPPIYVRHDIVHNGHVV